MKREFRVFDPANNADHRRWLEGKLGWAPGTLDNEQTLERLHRDTPLMTWLPKKESFQ